MSHHYLSKSTRDSLPPSPTSSSSSASIFMPRTPPSDSDPIHSVGNRASFQYRTCNYDDSTLTESDAQEKRSQPSIAQRRASHNAVERARRETLNGRFLDLAALLPNLKHLRRPSKSSIVNSSIAHVRAARRYRLLASQQLRTLDSECEQHRREVNRWRARAGFKLIQTPLRSEAFQLILSGEEPEFDPLDLDGLFEDEDELFPSRRRTAQADEASCEGPLVLVDPYQGHADRGTREHEKQFEERDVHASDATPTIYTPPDHLPAFPSPLRSFPRDSSVQSSPQYLETPPSSGYSVGPTGFAEQQEEAWMFFEGQWGN